MPVKRIDAAEIRRRVLRHAERAEKLKAKIDALNSVVLKRRPGESASEFKSRLQARDKKLDKLWRSHDRAREAPKREVQIPPHQRGIVRVTESSEAFVEAQPFADRGLDWVESYIRPEFYSAPLLVTPSPTDRSKASPPNHLKMVANAHPKTWLHEAGHLAEFSSPELYTRAVNLRTAKTQGEPLQKLKDMFPGNFEDNEVTRPDRFETAWRDPELHKLDGAYAGKIYPDYYHATEMITMGLEALAADPVEFATNHPEWFDLTVSLGRGKLSAP